MTEILNEDFGFNELEIGRVYSKWIYFIIKPYIQKSILEIGSGIGTMIPNFDENKFFIASDINNNYLKIIRKKNRKRKKFKVIHLNVEKISEKQLNILRNSKIDTIIAINILEHIKNDQIALNNMNKILETNGRVIIFVPNCPRIYGSLDKSFGHYRRYTKKDITNKLKVAKFQVEAVRNFNFFGILWWFIIGRIFRKRNLPKNTGIILNLVVPIIQKIESLFPVPLGQSLVVVGKK